VLRARVTLPKTWRGQPLELAFPYFAAKAKLAINGRPVLKREAGPEHYHGNGPLSWHLPPWVTSAETLALDLVVEHRWHRSAWIDTVPRIGPSTPLAAFIRSFNSFTGSAALAVLLTVAFTYLVIGLLDRQNAAPLWLALQTAAAAFYPFFELGLAQATFGTLDGTLLVSSLAVAITSSIYVLRHQFDRRISLVWPVWCVGTIVVMMIAHDPFIATLVGAPLVVAIVGTGIVTNIIFFIRRILGGQHKNNIYLGCWVALGSGVWVDFLGWCGLGELFGGLRLANLGLTGFSIFQFAALSRELQMTRRQLESRMDVLEQNKVEIERLNQELRRQVAERSRQWADALARLGKSARGTTGLAPGKIVEGRYRVIHRLGHGGMGAVYEVERLDDGRHLALKVMNEMSDPIAAARFAREAQFASTIVHPNTVPILDIDVSSDGFFYVVMELVDGGSLRLYRKRYGDVAWAVAVVADVAEGLAAIHDAGIVHRDLKPGNVLISQSTKVAKISDFGVSGVAEQLRARIASPPEGTPNPDATSPTAPITPQSDEKGVKPTEASTVSMPVPTPKRPDPDRSPGSPAVETDGPVSRLTRTGLVVGTPRYMAPELAEPDQSVGWSADIFSLGVMAFELFSNRQPFSEIPVETAASGGAIARPTSFGDACPSLPVEVASLLDRALSIEPDIRPTAQELAWALRSLERRPAAEVVFSLD
jgi:serine/threonine-protein kinase